MWPFKRNKTGLARFVAPPPPPPVLEEGDRVVVSYLLSTVYGKIIGRYVKEYDPISSITNGVWYIVEDDKGEKHNCWGKIVNKY